MAPASLAVTSFIAGDPLRLDRPLSTLGDLAVALEVEGLADARVLALAARVALVHRLTLQRGTITIRWVRVMDGAGRLPGVDRVAVALVLTVPVAETGRAVRLVGRLKAGLADPRVVDRALEATTREELVAALHAVDVSRQESPLAIGELLAVLGSRADGLAEPEAARRLDIAGPNQLERVHRRPLAWRLLEQFTSFFAVLLWIAAGFAGLAGMPELAVAIVVVIVVNGIGSFLQEYRAERALRVLEDLLPHRIGVVRDGRIVEMPAAALVPGDVIRIEEGDQVPADGQLLAADGLRVDQSALTGESHPVFKLPALPDERERVPRFERHEIVFAGTNVVAGSGTFVVTASGMRTEIGEVARLTQAVADVTSPLQREMACVTRVVTALAGAFGVFFFVTGVATGMLAPAEGFLFALGVIVANVPEGLLPTLTLALALGAQRMARIGSLMKRLSAIETLGATTVICTDKTGTLTEGRMAARSVWISGRVVPVEPGVGAMSGPRPPAPPEERPGSPGALPSAGPGECEGGVSPPRAPGESEGGVSPPRAKVGAISGPPLLLTAAVLASQATRDHGDPTEIALVVAAEQAGVDAEKVRLAHELVRVLPFDSFRKRMTMVRRSRDGVVAYVKGAPKETLALCSHLERDGASVPIDDEARRSILGDQDRLAAEGLRILAVATRAMPDDAVRGAQQLVERDLTFLGLVALWDPLRPEVPEAIGLCRRAGIRIIMVTGDYGVTAQAIARRIGLVVDTVVTGDEVERLGRDALKRLVERPGVLFARTSPAHKLAIVQALEADDEVVAVTGDGVNDAPALKAADIGVAMGRRGTEVAREAAEMVITDDNFASIVAAIRQGRAIYANMGKFITYIFTHNFAELAAFLAFVFCRIPLPLTVMQVLAVDLATDLVPALALGAEPPEPGIMDSPPRRRDERLLGGRRLLHAYAFLGVIEGVLSLSAFFWTYWIAGWRPGMPMAATGGLYVRATTMTLAGIVAAQVGNVFACRTEHESVLRTGLGSNRFVFAGVAAELAILLALILVPPLARLFGLAPLAFAEWGVLFAFPPVLLGLEEARKWIIRRARREGGARCSSRTS